MPGAAAVPYVEEISGTLDPAECCERLSGLPYRLFLDSAVRDARRGKYSFVMADPATVVRSRGRHVARIEVATGHVEQVEGDALEAIRALLAPHPAASVAGLPPFQGGAAGYLAYDWGRTLERLPASRFTDVDLPDVAWGLYDWVLAWDHDQNRAWLISTGLPETSSTERAIRARARAESIRARLERPAPKPTSFPTTPEHTGGVRAPSYPLDAGRWPAALDLRSSFSTPAYLHAVDQVRERILAGDIFQANLSQRFEVPFSESPWALYRRLRQLNPAPFAAYLELPEAAIISASPERFLHVDVDGRVETRPIKGTRPRGRGPDDDAALGAALGTSAKDRAENLMIVDLMRNDLSKVCAPGSVRVAELFALERYATVHHLVSTIEGRLGAGREAIDLLRAAFPGGSVTGAPKVRAMEIIAELEPTHRGIYCGTLGYLSVTGALDTSIAIRTAIAVDSRLYFSAGGAIVADSDPEQEYQETLDKARGIIDALTVRA